MGVQILKKLTFLYISLSGNTKNFVNRLRGYLDNRELEINMVNVKDLVREGKDFFHIPNNYVCFVPTYLEGGNGVDNGDIEILTTPLREFIRSNNNKESLVGIVGSGNKNFNKQYCLTAKQYSEEFNRPIIGDFELRGNDKDLEIIGDKIFEIITNKRRQ